MAYQIRTYGDPVLASKAAVVDDMAVDVILAETARREWGRLNIVIQI